MNRLLIGRRILLVEDEVLISCMLEDMLADLGCTLVGPAARLGQAMNLVASEAIDAVVLDVSLDRELSYPVADELIARGIPFVFSTGYSRERLQPGYQSLPMLQKPFYAAELERVLESFFPERAPVGPVEADRCAAPLRTPSTSASSPSTH